MSVLTEKMSVQAGNEQAEADFEVLFLQHYDRVYGLLYRLVGERAEAEDLAQEVFWQLYRRPPRQADSNISAWLYRVALNKGYNALRGRRRRWRWNWWLLPETSADPVQEAAERAEVAQVRRALSRLPQRDIQLLLLRQMDLSYAELAQVCQVAPTSVGALLARAARAFRAAYLAETREEEDHA